MRVTAVQECNNLLFIRPLANHFLLGGWATPLNNMSSSVGMMISQLGLLLFHTEWEKIMFQTTTLYLFALHADLGLEISALAVVTYTIVAKAPARAACRAPLTGVERELAKISSSICLRHQVAQDPTEPRNSLRACKSCDWQVGSIWKSHKHQRVVESHAGPCQTTWLAPWTQCSSVHEAACLHYPSSHECEQGPLLQLSEQRPCKAAH